MHLGWDIEKSGRRTIALVRAAGHSRASTAVPHAGVVGWTMRSLC